MACQSRPGVPSRKASASVAARSRRRRAMTPANGTVGSFEEMWVTGELLGFAKTLEAGAVVLVLDLPAADLSWLTMATR